MTFGKYFLIQLGKQINSYKLKATKRIKISTYSFPRYNILQTSLNFTLFNMWLYGNRDNKLINKNIFVASILFKGIVNINYGILLQKKTREKHTKN